MFCSQCGTQIDSISRFCPHCGAQTSSHDVDLFSKSEVTQPVEKSPADPFVVKKRRMPLWFKILAFLFFLALVGVTAGILFTESLVDVVDHQLSALRADDISKAYYAYTSKQFQQTTSLDEFRQFIQSYPIFSENKSAHFTQRSIKDHTGILKGNLTSKDHAKIPIEFKLIKEGDKWKILSLHLLKAPLKADSKENKQANDLTDLVKIQLKAIQDSHLKEAYESYSSQEFRKTTSLADFELFIKQYPLLTQYQKISFHPPLILSKGTATLSATLQSDFLTAEIKYYFVKENFQWKIWSLKISPPQKEKNHELSALSSGENPIILESVVFGDQTDDKGLINEPKTKFTTQLENLYSEIGVRQGRKGQVINLNLQHTESGFSIPAQTKIEENGDSLLISEFVSPSTGWPAGTYKLIITTSSGLNQVATFQID